MNFKRKLLLILISFIIIPFNTFAYSKYLIPGGENIGITVKADGSLVVGFYEVNGKNIAYDEGVRIGDKIVSINDKKITTIEELSKEINTEDEKISVSLGIIRDNMLINTELLLTKEKNGIYKTGMYVKDSITGIGTITFITLDKKYGALGHEIMESATNKKLEVKTGEIYESEITGIIKSKRGNTGEKNAKIFYNEIKGNVLINEETGIFGQYKSEINENKAIEVATMDEVKIGSAEIITVIEGNKKETFEIEILSIDKNSDTKNFAIKITDPKLLNKTGGIVKGMSGSPIIQNGKIIGAVTHAIVDKPANGYGISIIKMLETMDKE